MMIMLNVTGMACGHCIRSVSKALQAVSGVEKVSVDFDTGRARVDGSAAAEALVRAVEGEGYKAYVTPVLAHWKAARLKWLNWLETQPERA